MNAAEAATASSEIMIEPKLNNPMKTMMALWRTGRGREVQHCALRVRLHQPARRATQPRRLTRLLYELTASAGLPPVRLHDLRHGLPASPYKPAPI